MNETLDEESRKSLVLYRNEQAESTLEDAELLLANDRLNSAANRIYYACFYAAEALLIKYAIRATTHAGVRQMLGLHFVQSGKLDTKWGRFLSQVESMREGADYDFFIHYDKEELSEILPKAKEFISILRQL